MTPSARRAVPRLGAWLFALALNAALAASPIGPSAAAAALAEELLEVGLNGDQLPEAMIFLRDARGRLLIGAADLRRLRLRSPAVAALVQGGESYYLLEALAGLRLQEDAAQQRV